MKATIITTTILFLFYTAKCIFSASVTVETKYGKVIGIQQVRLGKLLDVFLGIPFAKPPVGELRFKLPQPTEQWSSPVNATKFSPKCPANSPFDPGEKSEDCLYLNIWRQAEVSQFRFKPVMVWIYGGAFLYGSSSMMFYDGSAFAAIGDVILVSFNYRVGVLGFLNANSPESPGNQGLHDQVMALKWVKENIHAFGGDPTKITIFGESAGAFSVGYHLISPLSRHLFHRAIMESGSPNDPLINTNHKRSQQSAYKFAITAGCSDEKMNLKTSPNQVIDCLRDYPFRDILAIQDHITNGSLDAFPPIYGDTFLPKAPYKALTEGDVGPQKEVLIGINRDEGAIFASLIFPEIGFNFLSVKPPNISVEQARKMMMSLDSKFEGVRANEVLNIYLSHRPSVPFYSLSDAIADYIFVCPAKVTAAKLADAGKNVYFYIYNYYSTGSLIPEWMGVSHFEEVPEVFGYPFLGFGYSKVDKEFSKRLVKTWTTFARYGAPPDQNGKKWKKFTAKDPHFLVLHPRKVYDVQQFHNKPCNWWIQNVPFLKYSSTGGVAWNKCNQYQIALIWSAVCSVIFLTFVRS